MVCQTIGEIDRQLREEVYVVFRQYINYKSFS